MPLARALLLASLLAAPLHVAAAEPPRVVSFSPTGAAREVRQVAATFSEPMVPFGDPRRAVEPFRIDCPGAGTARWIDERSWAYDFSETLPIGLRCTFELAPDLATVAGRKVGGTRSYTFTTGGPHVESIRPGRYGSVVTDQMFALRLQGAADPESVLRSAHFSVEGLRDRVGVRFVEGKDREEVLGSFLEPKEFPRWIVLQARQHFPVGRRVELIWGSGISTPSGVATTDAQRFHFDVHGPLTAEASCSRERKEADCIPILDVVVEFSTPVPWASARRVVLVREGGGDRARVEPDPIAESDDPEPVVGDLRYSGPFPPHARYRIEYPADLRDYYGQPLADHDEVIQTAGYPPLAKFAATFGLLELHADPALPVTVRALGPEVRTLLLGPVGNDTLPASSVRFENPSGAEILHWLRKLDRAGRTTPLLVPGQTGVTPFSLPLAEPPSGGDSMVVGIPLPKPGFHLVEIRSRALGDRLLEPKQTMYVAAGALVTDLAVHLLWGDESSLAWVTSLATGKPVPGAVVRAHECDGEVVAEGTSDETGVARLPDLSGSAAHCDTPAEGWSEYDGGLLVTATVGDDTGFVHSSWEQGIESWRFGVPTSWDSGQPLHVHTALDRKLLRAGETVHMKHFLRTSDLRGFAVPSADDLPVSVEIRHEASDAEVVLPVEFAANGSALSEWKIPESSRKGTYVVTLVGAENSSFGSRTVASFRVEDFRLPFMRATLRTPPGPQVATPTVPVDVAVQYLSGGGASGLGVTIRSGTEPMYGLPFDDAPGFEEFRFGEGPVRVGTIRDDADPDEYDSEEDESSDSDAPRFTTQALTLDASGTGRTEIPVQASDEPRHLAVELEYPDPAGITQTTSQRVALWPSARVAGIRLSPAPGKKEAVKVVVAVVDLAGKPVADADVTVEGFERRTYSHRRRLVGGFYAYSSAQETRSVGPVCAGQTDEIGLLECTSELEAAGDLIFQARTADSEGRAAVTYREWWAEGSEDDWSEPGDDDRMDLIPDRLAYEPGDTAKLRVEMPFRDATALVVVERRDVGRSFVTQVSAEEPVVEIPIESTYAPNVFVSVLAVRGRVADVQPTGMVDLGRPAFRLGLRELTVGWRDNRLEVRVEPEESVYHVREKARVEIEVETESGAALPADGEVLVAAVDEALLDLLPNDTWRLLDEMMGRRSHGIDFSTSQGLVIGRRHFGLKALPHGGGGGRRPTRELFDTLLLWAGRVPLDSRGRARVEIPLNDSMSSFRIVAIATAGTAQFGTGEATIQTTQELMVLPGIPPLVRAGDRYTARFTLRNTTSDDLDVDVEAKVNGLPGALAPISMRVPDEEAREAIFAVTAPQGVDQLVWEVTVRSEGEVVDSIRTSQRVAPSIFVRTLQGTVAPLDPSLSIPIEPPIGALPGQGGIAVDLKPSLAGGVDGVEEYLRTYPYDCLEQKVSRAIGLRDEAAWADVMSALPTYLDESGLAKFFPKMERGSASLTSYLLAISHEAGFEIPESSRMELIGGLFRFASGSGRRESEVPGTYLTLEKLAAFDALSRYGKLPPEAVSSITPAPSLWPTSALLDWIGILKRTPGIANAARHTTEARRILQSRLILQGTMLRFATQSTDSIPWVLATPDMNAARILIDAVERKGDGREVARLVRGTLGNQYRGRWDSTMADVWNLVALRRFSEAYEKTPVSGEVTATLASASERLTWKGDGTPLETTLPWPSGPASLELRQQGPGHPWAMIQARAAIPLTAPLSSGFTLRRTATPLSQKRPGVLSRGDLVKITLDVEAQTSNVWVVLRDPIPAGAAILGSGLGGGSLVADAAGAGCPCGASTERTFEAFTQYYSYVPQGPFRVEYVIVVNQDGTFQLPPSRVEAMYAPETFAETPIAPVVVEP